LGVASLITGGTPELLWLDEPLTAQDKDRRASILSMIRSLPTNQILLINHAQEAQDIVDYEITLKKSDD
jgi:energy-coupling factor transporter ATP-binding protein EcfA2